MTGTPLITFAPLDYAVLALFVVAILALGFSAKLRSNSMLQFLAAGRSLSLPLFVASLVSMWYGGVLGIGESVSSFGIGTWVLFGVPYYLFALIYAFFIAERVRTAEQLSIPERLQLRFGKNVALLGALLMFLLAVPAAHVLMLGTLVHAVTGWQLWVCVLVGTAVGASFLYRGGLLADARVSLLAFAMMYIGFAVIAGWCLFHYPFLPTLQTLPNKDLLKWDGGTGILYVISLTILGAWTLVDPGFHQRVTSSASPQIGKKGVLISTGFWFLFDVLSITTALYAMALNPKATGLDTFPALGNMVLPPGLKAVFFCGMLGTIVSAMVGYSLVSGATIGREMIGRMRPDLSDVEMTKWTRLGIGAACLVAIVLALKIDSVVQLWTNWAGAVVGAMLIPTCFAYLSKSDRWSGKVVFASIAVGFLVGVLWMAYGMAHGNAYLEIVVMHGPQGMSLVMPDSNADAASQSALEAGTKLAIGTLLPGLLASGLILLPTLLARSRGAGSEG